MIIYILYYLVFKILSSFVRDSSYHNMYYKGCGLLCAHKKSFNTAIPIRSLGPYMYVHYCTYIVHILVSTYLFLLTSFFDCLSFCGLFLKHPYKRFVPFYILYFYQSRFLNEPFVDRIFGFLTSSATKLDLDLKRRLVEIFFEFNKSPIKTKKGSKKIRDELENQLTVWQYIPEIKSLSFLSVGVPKDPSLR